MTTFARTAVPGVAASGLLAVAAAKHWAVAPGAADRFQAAGDVPLASALSLVALAAWGAILVTRGRVRQGMAVVGLLAAGGVVAVAVASYSSAPAALSKAVSTPGAAETHAHLSGWYYVAVVAAVVSILSFVVAVRSARQWPSMSSRYDSPSARADVAEPSANIEIWKALDVGDDPTDSGTSTADGSH